MKRVRIYRNNIIIHKIGLNAKIIKIDLDGDIIDKKPYNELFESKTFEL